MLLSTQTEFLGKRFGIEKTIEILAKAGFDAIDFSQFDLKDEACPFTGDDYRIYVKKLTEAAKANDVTFNQSHAPFPSAKNEDAAFNQMIFDRIVRSIEIAGLLGAKSIVVHPMQHLPYLSHRPELREANLEFYSALAPYAKAAGVKICLENMWQRDPESRQIVCSTCSTPADFIDYLDMLADDCFTACLDLGHCGLYGIPAEEMILELGNRITALHIHDNNNLDDQHTMPYLGKMNWDAILTALCKIGYAGDFTLEADGFYKKFPVSMAADCARFLAIGARQLMRRLEETKAEVGAEG